MKTAAEWWDFAFLKSSSPQSFKEIIELVQSDAIQAVNDGECARLRTLIDTLKKDNHMLRNQLTVAMGEIDQLKEALARTRAT